MCERTLCTHYGSPVCTSVNCVWAYPVSTLQEPNVYISKLCVSVPCVNTTGAQCVHRTLYTVCGCTLCLQYGSPVCTSGHYVWAYSASTLREPSVYTRTVSVGVPYVHTTVPQCVHQDTVHCVWMYPVSTLWKPNVYTKTLCVGVFCVHTTGAQCVHQQTVHCVWVYPVSTLRKPNVYTKTLCVGVLCIHTTGAQCVHQDTVHCV